MRSFLFLAVLAASASASILKRITATNLPASAFTPTKVLPFSDAQAGTDLVGLNTTQSTSPFGGAQGAAVSAAEAACSANPNVRIEWRSYSTSQRLAFISAIKCLMAKPPSGNFPPATSRYEDFVRLHQMWMPNIHGNPKFLVWHRYFLWTWEMTLRDECGFNQPFPWWDETLDAGNFANSDMFTNTNYFGHLPGPDPNGNPYCIVSGAFAGLTCHIGPGTSTTTPHCLSRMVDETLTAQCNSGFVNLCNSRTDYASMESCSEGGPHAYGHNGIGAVMSDVSASPSDPIFWMHHSFIDHNFRIWENADPARLTTINGDDHFGNPLTLNTVVTVADIFPDVTIGQIMNTMSGVQIGDHTFCYRYSY